MAGPVSSANGAVSNLKSAVVGLALAPLMLIGAVGLLSWNENRSVERIRTLSIGERVVVPGDAERPRPGQDGQLVHVSGRLAADVPVADPQFGLSLPAVALEREVAMYQWVEESSGTGKSRSYRYAKAWDTELIDSSEFRDPQGHENPGVFPVESRRVLADGIELGALTLGNAMRRELSFTERYVLTEADAAALPTEARRTYALSGGVLRDYDGEPRVGDVRVSFAHIPYGPASGVAMQANGRLEAYQTGHGDIALLASGELTPHELFERARTENAVITWFLRAAGLFLLVFGFVMAIRPLTAVAGFVPVLGGIIEALGLAAAFLAATIVWLATVSVAWLAVRPVLSLGLLGLIGGVLVIGAAMRKGRSAPVPVVRAARSASAGPVRTFGRAAG